MPNHPAPVGAEFTVSIFIYQNILGAEVNDQAESLAYPEVGHHSPFLKLRTQGSSPFQPLQALQSSQMKEVHFTTASICGHELQNPG